MAASSLSTRLIISRIGAGVLGGYVFIWGFMALGIAGFYALNMPFHDAESLSSMLGLLLYLVVFLWAFSSAKLSRVWVILVGGGLLMTATGALIQHSLI